MTTVPTTIQVYRDIQEDSLKCYIFGKKRRMIRLVGSVIMDLPEGCCAPPIRQGFSIRMKPNCCSICIDKYTRIVFEAASRSWAIYLPQWYAGNLDQMVSDTMVEYGFNSTIVISDGK